MKYFILICALISSCIWGEFTPWYTGPLLTQTPYNVLPGFYNLQPYLYVFDTFANYSTNSKSIRTKSEISTNVSLYAETGITKWLDITVVPQFFYNTKDGESAFGMGDLSCQFGIQLNTEKKGRSLPAMRLLVTELIPTGKYEKLDEKKDGIDALGSGSYVTTFVAIAGKIVYWIPHHPMQFRINLSYSLPSKTKVKEFNTYGGGFDTSGEVMPGKSFIALGSVEFSFTQKWVYAMDFNYQYNWKNSFRGNPGVNSNGTTAQNNLPASAQFSIAPAIEYNFNANFGVIGGIWVTLAGKNAKDFISGVLSCTYTW